MEVATYIYKRKEGIYPFATLVTYELKVEIIDDKGRGQIAVKFLNYHADGRPPGTISKVWPKSLRRKIQESASRSGKTAELEEYLNNLDPELIRKPYIE